jgi:glycosyltransferase involved in cell wall biosynthesis
MWARILARLGEVWIVTRTRHREGIEAGLPHVPERERLHFVYVDLPLEVSPKRVKRAPRAALGSYFHYIGWQIAALLRARSLRREARFDIAWHLTISSAWLGSLAPMAAEKFVYGPVGGGVRAPWRLLPATGLSGTLFEVWREIARGLGRHVNPIARLAWSRASLILVQNPETRSWLPRRYRDKARVFPNMVLEELPGIAQERSEFRPTAVFAGRLIPWKGVALAIEAVALTSDWHLVVCGDGPDEMRLQRLTARLGAGSRVTFLGWQPRATVLRLLGSADVLLYPSLHDDAPWVVGEAMGCGLPVVCLDRGGPPVLAGDAGEVVSGMGARHEVVRLLSERLQQLGTRTPGRTQRVTARAEEFTLPRVSDRLARLLQGQIMDWIGEAESA